MDESLSSFVSKYDYILEVNQEGVKAGKKSLGLKNSQDKKLIDKITSLLTEGLENRVSDLDVLFSGKKIYVGVIPQEPNFYDKVIRGPPLNSVNEAAKFRSFWGKHSECRQFADLTVCETVYFPADKRVEQRNIWSTIVKVVLDKHLNISPEHVTIIGQELSGKLKPASESFDVYGSGEELTLDISLALVELTKLLRSLKDLPLGISGVTGVSPVFRGTEVFPATRMKDGVPFDSNVCRIDNNIVLLKPQSVEGKEASTLTPVKSITPYEVVVHLEFSGKWPDDIVSLRAVKAQYIMEVCRRITTDLNLPCKSHLEFLDVLFNGYCFRLTIELKKELTLLREIKTSTGVITKKMNDIPEAEELYFRNSFLPKISLAINSMNTTYASFNPISRLIKRWISSQHLSHYIDDIVIDLLVVRMFLPSVHTEKQSSDQILPPASPFSGLLRFLDFISCYPFSKEPVFINFSEEYSDSTNEYHRMKKQISSLKGSIPGIVIVTPFDSGKVSLVTRLPSREVSKGIVDLLKQCAKRSKVLLLAHVQDPETVPLDSLFSFSRDKIHVVIELKKGLRKNAVGSASKSDVMPVTDFHPLRLFLQALRRKFGHLAMFLFDEYSESKQQYILCQWKPMAFQTHPVTSLDSQRMDDIVLSPDKKFYTYHLEAALECFSILGQGLIRKIHTQTSNWPV